MARFASTQPRQTPLPFTARHRTSMLVMAGALSVAIPASTVAQAQPRRADPAVTRHRTATVDGIDIFYREAGAADAPRSCCCTAFRRRLTCFGTSFRRSRIATA